MSGTPRLIGLILALAMLAFSAYMYCQTGDWVAAVFLLGSIGYVIVFFSTGKE